jgi:hypothetical protein
MDQKFSHPSYSFQVQFYSNTKMLSIKLILTTEESNLRREKKISSSLASSMAGISFR